MIESLVSAVRRRSLAQVQKLLGDGARPDVRDPDTGMPVLLMAACQADVEIVQTLLQAGADVGATDSRAGATALHKACQGGSLEVVRLLVEAGAFVDAVAPTTGHTPLFDAIWFKSPEIVEYLLDKNAVLEVTTHYGFTLEEHVKFEAGATEVDRGRIEKIRALVAARRQSDAAKELQQRLMAAVVADRDGSQLSEVVDLIASGAELDARFPVLTGFNDLHTPLLVACREGHTQIAEKLLEAGANLNAVEPTFGAVPLHKAVYNGHADIVRNLVSRPGINLNFQGYTNGYTPLHDSLWHGFEECARILILAGARLDLLGHDGKSALDLARQNLGERNDVTKLIEAKLQGATKMLFYVQMRWNYEGRLTLDQLWDQEYKETEHAEDTPGMVVGIYKVAAQPRVIVIVNVSSIEELDRTVYRLPMAEYLEFEEVWALREYAGFAEDVRKHYKP